MKHSDNFILHDGYTVVKKSIEMEIPQARQLLLTRAINRYSSVVREDETAVLIKPLIICECGAAISPFPRYIKADSKQKSVHYRASHEDVQNYLSDQLTLFYEPLQLNEAEYYPQKFHCKSCGLESKATQNSFHISIEAGNKKVTMSVRSTDVSYLFRIMSRFGQSFNLERTFTEQVIFNFSRGKAYWRILGHEMRPLIVRDFSYDLSNWRGMLTYDLINNRIVRRKLRKAMVVSAECVFDECELSPLTFTLQTLFEGYEKQFFDRIPVVETGLDKQFNSIARKMHRAADLPKVLNHSDIKSKSKAIKRFLYCKPELFFYIKELEFLNSVICNNDYFRQIITSAHGLELLSIMSEYNIQPFLADYATTKGISALSYALINHWSKIKSYAIDYSSRTKFQRRKEQKLWKNQSISDYAFSKNFFFEECEEINDYQQINGYDFIKLCHWKDFQSAGKALNNCLTGYEVIPQAAPVFVVKRKEQYLAAIEVSGERRLLQMLGRNNEDIPHKSGLYRAIKKWMMINNIEYHANEKGDLLEEYDNYE